MTNPFSAALSTVITTLCTALGFMRAVANGSASRWAATSIDQGRHLVAELAVTMAPADDSGAGTEIGDWTIMVRPGRDEISVALYNRPRSTRSAWHVLPPLCDDWGLYGALAAARRSYIQASVVVTDEREMALALPTWCTLDDDEPEPEPDDLPRHNPSDLVGQRVYVEPRECYGTATIEASSFPGVFVDYDDEHGGHYYPVSDLRLAA